MSGFLKNYVNGAFVESKAKEKLDIINPATLETLGQTPLGTREDVDEAVKAAKEAFKTWSVTAKQERSNILMKLADTIEKYAEDLVKAESKDNGKPETLRVWPKSLIVNRNLQ